MNTSDKSERRLPLSSTKPTSTMQYYPIRPTPFQWLPGTLAEEFRSRDKLREELQNIFFDAVSQVFTPRVQAIISDQFEDRLKKLCEAAEIEIKKNVAVAEPRYAAMINTRTQLELLNILCEDYREAYFRLMKIIGVGLFDVIGDRLNQREGRKETEDVNRLNRLGRLAEAASGH
ncbi:hypothetical protein BJ322DRAFT_1113582 [Thelephora terrestris]|uniref:Uncharacterized protein n=1 Tax=Thelephora terrestris TaxID=56493 RepID=A0A9P6L1Z3_9AGAM|nr:hypothetical protein BJ322DRAFT_1113582 [Thelephora terrestris]